MRHASVTGTNSLKPCPGKPSMLNPCFLKLPGFGSLGVLGCRVGCLGMLRLGVSGGFKAWGSSGFRFGGSGPHAAFLANGLTDDAALRVGRCDVGDLLAPKMLRSLGSLQGDAEASSRGLCGVLGKILDCLGSWGFRVLWV